MHCALQFLYHTKDNLFSANSLGTYPRDIADLELWRVGLPTKLFQRPPKKLSGGRVGRETKPLPAI